MRRNKKNIESKIAMILREGDGIRLWEIFHAEMSTEDNHLAHSSSEVRFLSLMERYTTKHRLSFATAHGRFLSRFIKFVKKCEVPSNGMHHPI